VEERQGMMISCPEEIAYHLGYINSDQVRELATKMAQNSYAQYLIHLLEEPGTQFEGE
jgi:glucose-1-phosphate thymidylyltransferase